MGGGWCGHLPEASIARHAIEACGRFRGAAHHGTARRRRTTPQDQLNTPVHWARWTVRQQLTLRTSGAIIRHGAIIRSLLVKRKQEYHEACPPNVLTAVCRSGASQVGHCLHLSVERFGYGCTFWCVYVSSCFSLVLGTVQAWHYGAITWTASRA